MSARRGGALGFSGGEELSVSGLKGPEPGGFSGPDQRASPALCPPCFHPNGFIHRYFGFIGLNHIG